MLYGTPNEQNPMCELCTFYRYVAILFKLQALCAGVLVVSGIAVSTIDNLFSDIDDGTEASEDKTIYKGVAIALLFAASTGIVLQVVIIIIRGLYYVETIKYHFLVFSILVGFNLLLYNYVFS